VTACAAGVVKLGQTQISFNLAAPSLAAI